MLKCKNCHLGFVHLKQPSGNVNLGTQEELMEKIHPPLILLVRNGPNPLFAALEILFIPILRQERNKKYDKCKVGP